MKRLRVIYQGRVQGVGFRFTAEAIALGLHLTGWVKNLPNGDVELLGEGPKDSLNRLMDKIRASALGKYIQKEKVSWEAFRNEFSDFRVEFVY